MLKTLSILGFLTTLFLMSSAANALIPHDKFLLAQATQLNTDQAAEIARKINGGRVLDVRVNEVKGRSVYEVKVLSDDGHVRIIEVDSHGKPDR